MITKTTISHNRANYLEQFGELSKTISAETITEAFDSDSLRKVFSENALSSLEKDNVLKDLKQDSTLLEVLSEIAKELNSDTFDFESLENFYKEFNLESTPPEWFRSAKAVKDSKKVGDFKKFYKIMFDMSVPESPGSTAISFAECMRNYFYLSSKDYETIRNEFEKLFRSHKFGFSSNHSRLVKFLFNPGINSFYKFLNSIFSANEKRIKAEFKIFYSFSKNNFSFKKDINNFEIGILKLNKDLGIPSNHATKISESDSPAGAIKEIISSMIKSHYKLLSTTLLTTEVGVLLYRFDEGKLPLELLTDEELRAYLRNKDLFSLQMSFSNLNEIQKDRISKIIYSYVFEENEF